jgi:glutamyl-tRNA synthetase
LLYQAFGWEEPAFIHLSLFLKPSGKGKMSKRESAELIKDGYSIFVRELRELGYLPEAVVNWTSLMGWAYDDHTEFFNLPDLVEKFSIDHLNPSPAAINFTKFDHFNGLHIRALSDEDLANRLVPFFAKKGLEADLATLVKIAPLIKERIATLDDAPEIAGFFFHETVEPKVEELVGKNMTAQESAATTQKVLEMMQSINSMDVNTIEPPLRELVEGMGYTVGQVFGILRVAVTGQRVSPPLFESMEIIGRDKVLNRIKKAIELLQR